MLDLKACYSPADIIFVLSLFVTCLFTVGAFIILMVHLVKGALDTVKDIKESKIP